MRILYVSQYFPPEMGAPAARVHGLAKHWVELGHQVTVLTGFPNHPTGVVAPAYRSALRRGTMRERLDGIEVVRTWLYPAPNGRLLDRTVNYASFCLSACIRGIVLRRPDVVIGTSPQLLVGLAGWWISRIKRCPFVFEVRDIWPEAILAAGVGREDSAYIRTLSRVASFLYRRADLIVTVTYAAADRLARLNGVPPRKIRVLENAVDTSMFRPVDSARVRAELGLDGRFVVSYIGTLGHSQGLETLVRAAARLETRLRDALFLVVGEGVDKDRLVRLARELGLTNVRFMDQQPRERVRDLVCLSDVCLVHLRNSEVFDTAVPSKMFEFMACARPLILGVGGEAKAIVTRAGAGLCIEPGSVDDLVRAVERLHADPSLRSALGRNGREFVVRHYSRREKALQGLAILEELLGRRRTNAGVDGVNASTPRLGRAPVLARGRTLRLAVKRAFDVLVAATFAVLLAPVAALIALAIRLDDGGPVLFVQERVGRGGRPFRCPKFRTMRAGAALRGAGGTVTEDDDRLTRVGRLLRLWTLDEIPQLWSILKGDMSVVGPRPWIPGQTAGLPAWAWRRFDMRPGLAGWAWIHGRNLVPWHERLRLDVWYVDHWSLRLDALILLKAFLLLFRRHGVYGPGGRVEDPAWAAPRPAGAHDPSS
ncbi:MAG TPA: sugar transferase [Vicinamibacterales bacterium]|nr:sugar transferase [Vicinamibacterales bacterium]